MSTNGVLFSNQTEQRGEPKPLISSHLTSTSNLAASVTASVSWQTTWLTLLLNFSSMEK